MLCISDGSVCETGTAIKDIAEVERMLKPLIKSSESKPLNPGPPSPARLEKNY